MRLNCWEFMDCRREPGGSRAAELGECPAALTGKYDSINHGANAGRICWAVAGTFCGGVVQGTFAQKHRDCMSCAFYLKVAHEESLINI